MGEASAGSRGAYLKQERTMVYDPRDRQVTWADCAVGGALWAFALALLVLFGDRLPDQQALAAVHFRQNVSKAPMMSERPITWRSHREACARRPVRRHLI